MATFAKQTFSAASYAAFRPTYPQKLYDTVLAYHRGPCNLAVDLGCGHGLVTRAIAPHFSKVIGLDPSARMITQASSSTPASSNIGFRAGSAEDLDFVADGSLDFVCAGQAAHWFDYTKVWPLLSRKMRKGGTVAFWGYKDNVFPERPKASKVLDHYCYALGVGLMGEFWEQPGRQILRDRLHAIVPPASDFDNLARIEYEPSLEGRGTGEGELLMAKTMKMGEVENYFRTFSAYHNWMEANVDRKTRSEGGQGDVVDDMFDEVLQVEEDWRKKGDAWREIDVYCEWGSAIVLARKL